MVKDLSLESRSTQSQNCAPIESTTWPRTESNTYIGSVNVCLFFVSIVIRHVLTMFDFVYAKFFSSTQTHVSNFSQWILFIFQYIERKNCKLKCSEKLRWYKVWKRARSKIRTRSKTFRSIYFPDLLLIANFEKWKLCFQQN